VNAAPEPETLSELIADCAEIPVVLQAAKTPLPRMAAPVWQVDDTCQAQVADLDAYV
jgi:hypothetical protein